MSSEQAIFDNIKLFIETELNNQLKSTFVFEQLIHNHPPLRFKVKGCPYCDKHGNIFSCLQTKHL